MPSIIAASVLGRMGIHSAASASGASARVGLTTTLRMPAWRARASQPGALWSPAPPEAIWVLRKGMPPNAISSRVWLTTLFQSVMRPVTGA